MSQEEKIIKYVENRYIKDTDIKRIVVIREGQLLDVTKDYTRTWIDNLGNPFKYEFRGEKFQGYLSPHEVVITK